MGLSGFISAHRSLMSCTLRFGFSRAMLLNASTSPSVQPFGRGRDLRALEIRRPVQCMWVVGIGVSSWVLFHRSLTLAVFSPSGFSRAMLLNVSPSPSVPLFGRGRDLRALEI